MFFKYFFFSPPPHSRSDYIGTREVVLLRPPGFFENPRPVYDVITFIDMSPDTAEIYQTYITDLFNAEAADAMVIGFGDFRETPDGQARDSTRFLYK